VYSVDVICVLSYETLLWDTLQASFIQPTVSYVTMLHFADSSNFETILVESVRISYNSVQHTVYSVQQRELYNVHIHTVLVLYSLHL